MKKPRSCRGLRVAAISCNYPDWRGQDLNYRKNRRGIQAVRLEALHIPVQLGLILPRSTPTWARSKTPGRPFPKR
jgi:hypothetical protein